MNTIFVIEQGSYSDYHVVGVYSTRENAEKALAIFNGGGYDRPEISEWLLDPHINEINQGLILWRVWMKENGDNSDTQIVELRPLRGGYETNEPFTTFERNDEQFLCGHIWAADSPSATKILNERRTQAIAEGRLTLKGPPDPADIAAAQEAGRAQRSIVEKLLRGER